MPEFLQSDTNNTLKEQIVFQNEKLHYSLYYPENKKQFYEDVIWHWHDEFEFGYILEGSMLYKTNQHEYVLHEGDGIFINSGILHYLHLPVSEQNTRIHTQFCDKVFLAGMSDSVFDNKYIRPVMEQKQLDAIPFYHYNQEDRQFLAQITAAARIAQEQANFFEFHLRSIFSTLWEVIYTRGLDKKIPLSLDNNQDDERIKKMLLFIQENYSHKLTVRQIAGCVPISERECYRIFQNKLETSPIDFLISLRLKKAQELLLDTKKSIVEVALESGFENSSYFGKLFKKQYNVSPGKYRSQFHTMKE